MNKKLALFTLLTAPLLILVLSTAAAEEPKATPAKSPKAKIAAKKTTTKTVTAPKKATPQKTVAQKSMTQKTVSKKVTAQKTTATPTQKAAAPKKTIATTKAVKVKPKPIETKIAKKNTVKPKIAHAKVTPEKRSGVRPYVGIDAEWRHTNFQKGFGDNLFKHDYPQGDIYVGLLLNPYFGIEGGYEITTKKTRAKTLFAGETSTGITIPGDPTDHGNFSSTGKIKGPHIDLVTFIPIRFYGAFDTQLIGMVGAARLKAKFVKTLLSLNDVPDFNRTNYIKRKTILRLGGGIQNMLTDHWGFRAMIKWENTHKLTMGNDKNDPENLSSVRTKNSLIYSIGTFVIF